MINVEYKAKVLSDGHLSCPEKIKRRLHLSNGSEIKVILLSKLSIGSIKEMENSKAWDNLEKIGVKITRLWKSEKPGWQLVTEGRR